MSEVSVMKFKRRFEIAPLAEVLEKAVAVDDGGWVKKTTKKDERPRNHQKGSTNIVREHPIRHEPRFPKVQSEDVRLEPHLEMPTQGKTTAKRVLVVDDAAMYRRYVGRDIPERRLRCRSLV